MAKETMYKSLQSAKLESFLDPSITDIDETWWPDKDDFIKMWDKLTDNNKIIVTACVSAQTIGELIQKTHKNPRWIIDKLKRDPAVIKAVICARMCQLPSDTARHLYIETVFSHEKARQYFFDEIQKIIITDKDHLVELASKLDISGDGKRDILKTIVAYGMQVKKVEDEIRDEATSTLLAPAVMALADPRMAFNAVQELNRMDHEYGQDDKATSSIEGQADRIRRLRQSMDRAASSQAKKVGAIARRVATRELKEFQNGMDK